MALLKNYDDVAALLISAGLELDGPLQIDTSKMVRCFIRDDDRTKKRGAYRLYEVPLENGDSVVLGTYGFSKAGVHHFEKIPFPKSERKAVDAERMAAIRQRMALEAKRAEAERQRVAEQASAKASAWWSRLSNTGRSAYLERKGFEPGQLFGCRVSASGNLVVPCHDGDARIWGLEVIYGDPDIKRTKGRDKEFTPPGMVKKGHWFQIGSPIAGGVLLMCEGVATGCSLHVATGLPVVVAFDAGNLLPVARNVAKRYRSVRILVCADDDYLTTPNTGVQAAISAATAVGGSHVVPVFPIVRSEDKSRKGPTDFNDLHVLPEGGRQMVCAQVEAAIASAGWSMPMGTASGGASPRGEGGAAGEVRPVAVSTLNLNEIVERFIHIDDITGDFVFDYWTNAVCKKTKVINMLPARVRWDDVKDHPTWRSRAVYIDQIGFDPGGEDPNIVCNRWSGWPTTPAPGKCERQLELLRYLCSNEPKGGEVFRWMLCWLAYPLQNPGAKLQSAIVIHGPQGTGKSMFFEGYARIYGGYSMVLNQGAIEDKFNSDWCERKLFILADEIVARQDMYHLKNQLKAFITGEWVRVNPKNVAAHRERNHMNLVFLSNEKQPVVLENDDRRHLVLWTPPALSKAYYDEVWSEMESGGIAALHQFLLDFDCGDFKPWSRPPMTLAKGQLIDINRESVERFLADWQEGDIEGLPFCPCASGDLYGAYLVWCRRSGVKSPRESNQFMGHIEKLQGWYKGHKDRYTDTYYTGTPVRQRFVIPPDTALEAVSKRPGQVDYRKKPEKTQTQWLTDCFFAFRNAHQGSQP